MDIEVLYLCYFINIRTQEKKVDFFPLIYFYLKAGQEPIRQSCLWVSGLTFSQDLILAKSLVLFWW